MGVRREPGNRRKGISIAGPQRRGGAAARQLAEAPNLKASCGQTDIFSQGACCIGARSTRRVQAQARTGRVLPRVASVSGGGGKDAPLNLGTRNDRPRDGPLPYPGRTRVTLLAEAARCAPLSAYPARLDRAARIPGARRGTEGGRQGHDPGDATARRAILGRHHADDPGPRRDASARTQPAARRSWRSVPGPAGRGLRGRVAGAAPVRLPMGRGSGPGLLRPPPDGRLAGGDAQGAVR